jgi:hypothetical protein
VWRGKFASSISFHGVIMVHVLQGIRDRRGVMYCFRMDTLWGIVGETVQLLMSSFQF